MMSCGTAQSKAVSMATWPYMPNPESSTPVRLVPNPESSTPVRLVTEIYKTHKLTHKIICLLICQYDHKELAIG